MDDFWVEFYDSNKSINNAYIASNEKVSVLCSYGETEAEAFRQMGNLLNNTDFVNLISQSGHYMDDDVYCMTVVVSHTKAD
jgi:hypothetical protein